MSKQIKVAIIGAAAIIFAAVIAGLFSLWDGKSDPTVQQQVKCGPAINDVQGDVSIRGEFNCRDEEK